MRLSQRPVEGVDRAVALGGGHDPLVAHQHLDGGLGGPARPVVGDDPVRLEVEEGLLPSGGVPQQELERAVGHLEVVALVLEPLERVENRGHGLRVELEAQLRGLHGQGGTAGHLGDHEPGAVAHQVGRDVLVGIGPPGDGRGVEAGLVGEDRGTDEGLLGVGGDVDQLGDVVGHRGEQLQPIGRDGGHPQLEGEVGDRGGQVGVAGALAVPVHAALDVGGPTDPRRPASWPPRSRCRCGSGPRPGSRSGPARAATIRSTS